MQEQLSRMADVAGWLETEGVKVLSAKLDMVQGPRLQVWGQDLPPTVERLGKQGWPESGYTGCGVEGVTIFWFEQR